MRRRNFLKACVLGIFGFVAAKISPKPKLIGRIKLASGKPFDASNHNLDMLYWGPSVSYIYANGEWKQHRI